MVYGSFPLFVTQEKLYVLKCDVRKEKKVMKCGMAFIIHDKDSYYANKEQIKKLLVLYNEYEHDIFKASTVEYKGNLYLIIDGYYSLLDWQEPSKELEELKELYEDLKEECEEFGDEVGEFVDRRFLHNFLMLTYPAYAKNQEFFYKVYTCIKLYESFNECLKYKDEDLEKNDIQELDEEHQLLDDLLNSDKFITTLNELYKESYSRENICYGFMYGRDFDLGSLVFEEKENKIDALSTDIFNATIEEKDVKEVKFIETLYEID